MIPTSPSPSTWFSGDSSDSAAAFFISSSSLFLFTLAWAGMLTNLTTSLSKWPLPFGVPSSPRSTTPRAWLTLVVVLNSTGRVVSSDMA